MRGIEALRGRNELSPSHARVSGWARNAQPAISTSCGYIGIHRSPGAGMPVLILDSEPSFRGIFAEVSNCNAEAHYNVVALDFSSCRSALRAGGRSTIVPELVGATLQVIEAFDIDYATVVGHAFGCLIAVELASSFPGAIATGLSGLRSPHRVPPLSAVRSTRNVTPLSVQRDDGRWPCERRHILHNVEGELSVFLKRADELYKEALANPMLWYGG